MKKIIGYLNNFYTTHLNKNELLFAFFFIGAFAYLNYGTSFIKDLKNEHLYDTTYSVFLAFLFGIPLFLGFVSNSIFSKDWSHWKNPRFWILVLLAIGVFTLRNCSHIILNPLYDKLTDLDHTRWTWSVLSTVLRSSLILVPLTLYWFFVDRKDQNLYGFTLKGFNTKPYFAMLLIMFPLIALASTQADFLGAYPRGQNFDTLDIQNTAHWKFFGLYELVYGLDFISIEFFFRGFMILAFLKLLGPKTLIPMAMFYVTIHWGKPAGELISSFFGGTLLGIITLYSRSIIGGIIVHMGIAWMMEIGALIGNYFNK